MLAQKSISRKKAILLIPYFGRWPEYFNLFLSSCEYNQWLDIMFITDCPIPTQFPKNVSFKKSNLAEVSQIISTRLNLKEYKLPAAYKLCDFKPTYGVLFEECISDYNYWAFGDIDLVYGNLEAKIKSEMSSGVDIISFREEIISGSFTLVRNNEYNNNLFKKLENFNELIVSTQYEGIDETGLNDEIWSGLSKLDLPKMCFTYLVAKEFNEGILKVSFKTLICEYLAPTAFVKFSKNELYFDGKTIGYFHYVMNKRKKYFTYPTWSELPQQFYIYETGFYKTSWAANLIGPIKKYFYLSNYYMRKAPNFLLKVLKK